MLLHLAPCRRQRIVALLRAERHIDLFHHSSTFINKGHCTHFATCLQRHRGALKKFIQLAGRKINLAVARSRRPRPPRLHSPKLSVHKGNQRRPGSVRRPGCLLTHKYACKGSNSIASRYLEPPVTDLSSCTTSILGPPQSAHRMPAMRMRGQALQEAQSTIGGYFHLRRASGEG